jgi:CRP/FNR family cyclic AMP-dependent transcriptional regulator
VPLNEQLTVERSSIQSIDEPPTFDFQDFLAQRGFVRRVMTFRPKENLFTQGDREDSVFYLQRGRAKVSVVSHRGKEATITLVTVGDFVGEEALAPAHGLRLSTVTALDTCAALRIRRGVMIRLLHDEPALAGFFWRFLLERGMKTQADLVDQLFNSSEKRLARVLLLMSGIGRAGVRVTHLPHISQQTLSEMVGTTRSRTSFFLNRFRRLGFISYDTGKRIQVHRSLLKVVLLDHMHQQEAGEAATNAPGTMDTTHLIKSQ